MIQIVYKEEQCAHYARRHLLAYGIHCLQTPARSLLTAVKDETVLSVSLLLRVLISMQDRILLLRRQTKFAMSRWGIPQGADVTGDSFEMSGIATSLSSSAYQMYNGVMC